MAPQVTIADLVDELAKVFPTPERAGVVVRRAGVATASIPPMSDPLGFWDQVIGDAGHGAAEGGVRGVVEQALLLNPGNATFKRFLLEHDGEAEVDQERPDAPTPFPGHIRPPHAPEPFELVVIGRRQGDRVHWSYRTGSASKVLPAREVAWDAGLDDAQAALKHADGATLLALGLRLGRMLLGAFGETAHHEVMRALFEIESPEGNTTPQVDAVRCRLVLDAALEALPWRLAAMEDAEAQPYWLCDHGWTFEHGPQERSRQRVELGKPCRIVFCVPSSGPLRDEGIELLQAAREMLGSLWSIDHRRLATLVVEANGRDETTNLAKDIHADVVVCLGRAVSKPEPSIELRRDDGVTETVRLAHLVDDLARAKVKLLVLATPQAITLPGAARGRLPCVLVPTQPTSAVESRQTLLDWLHALVAEGLDPVRALHRPPTAGPSRRWCAMRAHADFQTWRTRPAVGASEERSSRLRLDRDELRAVFIRHVDALVQDDRRIVEAFVVDGGHEDSIELLGEQLWEEHRARSTSWGASLKKDLWIPRGTTSDVLDEAFEGMLMQTLALDEGGSAQRALEAEAREHEWPKKPFVYWLEWNPQLEGIEGEALAAWMKQALRRLPQLAEGLRNIRVIVTLGVVPSDRALFRRVTSELMVDLASETPSDKASITALSLGAVTVGHIKRYLEDGRRCPLNLVQRVAEEIHRSTDEGAFQKVIALIDEIEHGEGWRAFAKARPAPQPTPRVRFTGKL